METWRPPAKTFNLGQPEIDGVPRKQHVIGIYTYTCTMKFGFVQKYVSVFGVSVFSLHYLAALLAGD